MVSYIFILIAVLCFALQFVFTKIYEDTVGKSINISLIMLVITSMVGTAIFFIAGGFKVEFSQISLIWGIALAVIMIPYYIIGIKVISLGSLAVYSMFMMLGGMLVPFFYGILFLNEKISIGKLSGTVLIALFIIFQAFGQSDKSVEKEDKKTKIIFFALCLVVFFINGMTGVIAKAHSISKGAVSETDFTVIYCFLTASLSIIFLIFNCIKNSKKKLSEIRKVFNIKPVLTLTILGGAAYGGNFFLLLAANKVPASVQFPLVSGGVIVLSALFSAFLFKENLSKKEWLSVLGAFLSTFLFAF
ncbi:MAG: hypothetical protein E7568_07380 [Ruminococcaceae bacterium]|nr:hypothetical protein [Oscillospiraceae bacterium]